LEGISKLYITWIKSDIGYSREQRQTLKALGFHSLGQTIAKEDSPSIRGMVIKVKHLIKVKVVGNEAK